MRTQRFINIGLAVLLTVTGLAAMAPTASAQQNQADANMQIEIDAFNDPIMPLQDLATGKVSGIYTYMAGGFSLTPVQVTYKVAEAPPWATVTVSPSTVLVNVQSSPQTGGSISANIPAATVYVATTADAPAFTTAPIKITATAAPTGNLKGANGESETVVMADFFSIIDGVPQTTIQTARPQQEVPYPINVQNFGNAPTKVFFEVVGQPEGWQVVPPPPVTLESKQAGGKNTAQTVNLMIQTPFRNGYLNEVGTVTLDITSAYSLDTKETGDKTSLSTLTTTRGFYVPGLVPLHIFAGLGAVALLMRRPSA